MTTTSNTPSVFDLMAEVWDICSAVAEMYPDWEDKLDPKPRAIMYKVLKIDIRKRKKRRKKNDD